LIVGGSERWRRHCPAIIRDRMTPRNGGLARSSRQRSRRCAGPVRICLAGSFDAIVCRGFPSVSVQMVSLTESLRGRGLRAVKAVLS
jgi:hypothetical protein